ncbi:MAG: carboxylesterase family protein [Succinatimonas hippei]|nr:carboxylesterase family protein [Succinatimonas hippei]
MIHRVLLTLLLSLVFVFNVSYARPIVKTPVGYIEGRETILTEQFLGIPYAKTPVGNLRYAPPAKIEPFANIYRADRYCKMSYQSVSDTLVQKYGMGDDSLCLNIFRPKNLSKSDKLPVLFWIHGGAYVQGSSATSVSSADSFVENGVIVVTLNYRLQFQGFMSTVQTYSQYGTTGNFGHLDILEALKWVNQNIESFGGDPANITIAGHSAGAMAASALILSPLSDGLFKRAFLQSGTILNYPFSDFTHKRSKRRAFSQTEKVLNTFGVSDNYDGLNTLRDIDPMLLSYCSPFDFSFHSGKTSYINPLFDGYFLPIEPYLSLKRGNFSNIELMLGYVSDEGTLFSDRNMTEKNFINGIKNNFGEQKFQDIYDLYSETITNSAYVKQSTFLSDIMFTLGMKIFADNLSKSTKVYMYHYAFAEKEDLAYGFGVYHGIDHRAVFNTFTSPSQKQKMVASVFHKKLVNFIKSGDPNKEDQKSYPIDWPKYTKNSPNVFRLDKISGIEELKIKDRLEKLEKIIYEGEL